MSDTLPAVCNPPCKGRSDAMSRGDFVLVHHAAATPVFGGAFTRRYFIDKTAPMKKNGRFFEWEVGASDCKWCGLPIVNTAPAEETYR